MPGVINPGELRSPELRAGYALWDRLRGARLFPSRAEMTPRSLGRLLRNVSLIKVLDGGQDFQIRIMGDGLMAVQSVPLVGLTTTEIDKLLPGYGASLHSLYSLVHRNRAPGLFRGTVHREADGVSYHREHVLAPLGETDEAVDHLISFVVFLKPDL